MGGEGTGTVSLARALGVACGQSPVGALRNRRSIAAWGRPQRLRGMVFDLLLLCSWGEVHELPMSCQLASDSQPYASESECLAERTAQYACGSHAHMAARLTRSPGRHLQPLACLPSMPRLLRAPQNRSHSFARRSCSAIAASACMLPAGTGQRRRR